MRAVSTGGRSVDSILQFCYFLFTRSCHSDADVDDTDDGNCCCIMLACM